MAAYADVNKFFVGNIKEQEMEEMVKPKKAVLIYCVPQGIKMDETSICKSYFGGNACKIAEGNSLSIADCICLSPSEDRKTRHDKIKGLLMCTRVSDVEHIILPDSCVIDPLNAKRIEELQQHGKKIHYYVPAWEPYIGKFSPRNVEYLLRLLPSGVLWQ